MLQEKDTAEREVMRGVGGVIRSKDGECLSLQRNMELQVRTSLNA